MAKTASLLSGVLVPTNEPYAIAKIAGIKLCEGFNRQFGREYRSVMRGNIEFDHSKPDGTGRKLLDVNLLRSLDWTAAIGLAAEGLKDAYPWFINHQADFCGR